MPTIKTALLFATSSIFAANLKASSIIIDTFSDRPPPPHNGGPVFTDPVGYDVYGVGQSVIIPNNAGGLLLHTFSFHNGSAGGEDGSFRVYVFDQEYRGPISDLASIDSEDPGGLLGTATSTDGNLFDFTQSQISLEAGTTLYFYTDQLTVFSVVMDYYEGGEFYSSMDSEEGVSFGDPFSTIAGGGIAPDLKVLVTANHPENVFIIPEPSSVSFLLMSTLGFLTCRRR